MYSFNFIRQRKESDWLRFSSVVPKIHWVSNPTAPTAEGYGETFTILFFKFDIVRVDAFIGLFSGCDCFGWVAIVCDVKASLLNTYMDNGCSRGCH